MDNQPQQNIVEESTPEISKKERREQKRQERMTAQATTRQMSSVRRLFIWVIALLAIGGSAAGMYYLATTTPASDTTKDSALIDTAFAADWIRGNPDSSVTLVEYADFQCPACAQYHPLVKILEQEFGTDAQFIFRHFPLSRAHPNAEAAAAAAEAAGMQGKFWEMRDILFERQTEWAQKPRPQSTFNSYAEELGLNVEKFEEDRNRDNIEEKIEKHFQSGTASNVNATPTFFLNGKKLESPRSIEDFRNLLSQAIAEMKVRQQPTEQNTETSPTTTPET